MSEHSQPRPPPALGVGVRVWRLELVAQDRDLDGLGMLALEPPEEDADAVLLATAGFSMRGELSELCVKLDGGHPDGPNAAAAAWTGSVGGAWRWAEH
jgi:hypothetical protein